MFPGLMNPALASVLAAQGGQQTDPSAFQAPDPLAPLPSDTPGLASQAPDSINDGISSVGRPYDAATALRKLHRQTQGQALLALGASLLGSRNFGEGLSKGLMAYTETLRSMRPTSKAVGDGEYEQVTDANGNTYYKPTPIHADKVAERAKPQIAGNRVVKYGMDKDGHYDGTVQDLTPSKLTTKTIKRSDGSDAIVFVDEDTGAVYDPKSGAQLQPPTKAPANPDMAVTPGDEPIGQAPTGVAPAPPPDNANRVAAAPQPATGGGFQPAVDFVLNHEGGYNPSDWNGQPVNFGINQKYHPNVAGLNRDSASAIYKSDYWDKSGADKLDPALQLPYFDTYVRNPSKARAFLAQAGGDPDKFMALREAWDTEAGKRHPGDAKGLMNRDRDLRSAMGPDTSKPYYDPAPGNSPAAPQATPEAASAPDNPWGLQPHSFAPAGPAVRWATPAELKQANLPSDSSAQIDAKGNFHLINKGTAPGEGPLASTDTDFYAQAILSGTPMSQLIPGMGKGAAAQRRQVMDRVAKMAGAEGLSGKDFSVQLAHYAAAKKNVANLETQLGTIEGNESTAKLNGQAFLKASAMVPKQTRSRLLNAPIQSFLRATGDPSIAAMDVAAQTFATEYAKVVAGTPSGGGTLSDSARNEAISILRGDYSLKQKMAAYQQAATDMNNRLTALRGNLHNAYSHMGDRAPELTGQGPSHAAAPQHRTIVRSGTFNGRKVVKYSDGTVEYAN
jgi:hypothetical protein